MDEVDDIENNKSCCLKIGCAPAIIVHLINSYINIYIEASNIQQVTYFLAAWQRKYKCSVLSSVSCIHSSINHTTIPALETYGVKITEVLFDRGIVCNPSVS